MKEPTKEYIDRLDIPKMSVEEAESILRQSQRINERSRLFLRVAISILVVQLVCLVYLIFT